MTTIEIENPNNADAYQTAYALQRLSGAMKRYVDESPLARERVIGVKDPETGIILTIKEKAEL
ncbi:hypothetical protein [Cytobacillus oceanisediminis]|uniref:hypothetical protein n=1 Tax=Cytobacillus oceanisediminis TaxID=665099 RepID=UPI001FB2FBF4|nr:hypothetical protein [Cytobacillus oceanisediminis]UOE58200.1 hypothetical protein IRB79_27240 [Cytobacillus oceanisediminis]